MKVKIITGFRKDQAYSIDADEAPIAYKLFIDPEQRAIFRSGVALTGKDIRAIEPDFVATMGWNASHIINDDDWNEIRQKGIDKQIKACLSEAKEIALTGNQTKLKTFNEKYRNLLHIGENNLKLTEPHN